MKTSLLTYGFLFLVCILASCASNSQSDAKEAAIPVEIYKPYTQDSTTISVSGVLTAKNTAQLSTRIMAFVDQIYVKRGDQVRKGQVLIRLNSDDLLAKKQQVQAQLAAAELAAANANKDYQRFLALHAKQSVSDKELENMKLNKMSMDANLKVAQQGLEEIDAMLSYTIIKAPFAGRVTQKYIDKGSTANPGMPLLTVEEGSAMEVSATIPENYIAYVAPGNPVEVVVKTLQRTLSGTISELSPSASQYGGQYAMKIALDASNDPSLLAGMYVGVHIPLMHCTTSASRIFIDKSSLVTREQLKGVYVVNENEQAVLRWLQVGRTEGNLIEVLSGLNNEEQVIRHVNGHLYNGRKVSIIH